mmetsp:Transcript_68347/g.108467  ORF Transcript_68347/g.108467 Transcript_68347/m.108467 type:complete len:1189 (+) Transcript_68347:69-3635(+)
MPEKEKKDKKAKKDEEDAEMDFGDKKKKKKSKDDSDDEVEKSDKKDKKEKKEKKEKRKPTPLVCSVLEIQPVPKKDKLRVCKVRVRDDIDPLDIVTNVPSICVGGKYLVALPGVTTADGIEIKETKVGGVDSTGMFCGSKQMGWDEDVLDPELPVMLDDSAEIGVAVTYEEALEAFRVREKREAAKAEAEASAAKAASESKADPKKKGKKKKGGKQDDDDDDFEAALAEAKAETKDEPAPAEEEEKQEEDEKVDAKTLANRKKRDKKKNKGAAADDDDDFESALQEAKADLPEEPEVNPEEDKSGEKAEEAEAKGDEEVDAKTLANRKKKDKKKAKQAATGAGFYKDDEEDGEKEDSQKPEVPAPAAKKGAAGKREKETAAAKLIRERLEAQRAIEEEKRAFEEAEKARIAEEERLEREEEERLEAERKAKREARLAKIERQKAEGTFQTKAQKLRAQRAAQLREQFGFDLDAQEAGSDGEGAKAEKKKTLASSKKKKRTQKQEEEEVTEEAPNEEDKTVEETKPEVKETKPPAAEEKETQNDESDDDWEKIADNMKEEPEADKKDDDDGSDSESGSGSGSDSSSSSSSDSDDFMGYRSPIVCIMGHVDTGKTKLLDKIRNTNVQEGEAGGITQQIGATFFPDIALEKQTQKVNEDFDIEVPGLLIIDTPGHESFNNLRKRGSSLCDLAILVIDIMHGLEPQTVESLNMLKMRKCPFIIALNKIDRCLNWTSESYTSIADAMERQTDPGTKQDFQNRLNNIMVQLNEHGLNCALYYENEHMGSTISIVPTSAMTGEGVPDLLYMLLNLSQNLMASQLEVEQELSCTVIEVKNIEGFGTTVDVVLINGTLKEGDQIVIAGRTGPIVTTIRALLTPAPMKEMRVKGEYIHHAQISVSMGVKISAPGLEEAVAGTELKVIGPDDDVEELKSEVQDGFDSILENLDKSSSGVFVKASTLGSLEALLAFLEEMQIPVFDVGIGEVQKKDVKRASIMKEKKLPEYAVILAFDVKVNSEATTQATHDGVKIFTADIIYHLKERFEAYIKEIQESKKTESRAEAVFPAILEIDKNYIFHKKDPIVVGCKILGGQLRIGTPICVPEKDFLEIGRVGGIEKDKKECKIGRKGESVCVKIEQNTSQNQIAIGRHFDHTNRLYSKISRSSIDTLKEHFKDEMKKEDWEVIISMKTLFKIQ